MTSERRDIYADRVFYQKNGEKSYLVMCSGEEPELPYQINMIKYNTIEGLLPVQFFIEDGEYRYFYDISCKESLSERMKQKKYSVKEIRTVMSDLYRCVQQMEEYLLNTDCLILEPEYLFTDKNDFKIEFCFYQDKKESFEKSLENLFDYFLNRLDYQDEKTVVLVYSLYQKSREKNVSLYELMKQFCELPSSEIQRKKTEEFSEKIDEEENSVTEHHQIFSKTMEKQKTDSYYKFIQYVPDMIGGLGIAVILWYISKNHAQMSGQTFMLWMFAIAGILAGCGICSTILSEFMEKLTSEQKKQSDEKINSEEMFDHETEKIKAEKFCDGDHGENVQEKYDSDKDAELFEEFCFEDFKEQREKISTGTAAIPATVVMGEPALFRIYNPVLISKNKNKFQDIVIKENTVVVGKVRGIADVCLEGKSVSRVHARISQDKDGCSVTDLGSTNGTYINGKRLAERQVRYLKQGDEVRFAEAVFEFKSEEAENLHSQQLSEVI